MKVRGRVAASTCIHNAKTAKKARHSQPAAAAASQLNSAATPRDHVNSSALFPHQDDAFEDFSDCGPRAIGATEPEDAERYSRTAAWVEEFHDDGWGDAFAGESVRPVPSSESRPASIHVDMSATQPQPRIGSQQRLVWSISCPVIIQASIALLSQPQHPEYGIHIIPSVILMVFLIKGARG